MMARSSAALSSKSRSRADIGLPDLVPYTVLLNPYVIHTRKDCYVQAFRISGCSFETSDDSMINDWHDRLNMLWRTIADPSLSIWCHLIRRSVAPSFNKTGLGGFAADLHRHYQDRLDQELLRSNQWYLAIAYKPARSATGPMRRYIQRTTTGDEDNTTQTLAHCERLSDQILSALQRYDIERLGVYGSNEITYSALLDYLGLLINADEMPTPLPALHTAEVLCINRPLIGVDAIEYRAPTTRRLGAFLAIKEYPNPSSAGMLNGLLKANFSFVLTQSFTFLPKPTAQGLLSQQFNRMRSAGDLAVSQTAALKSAMDQLAGNQFVLGDHHLSLQVLSEARSTWDDSSNLSATLEMNVAAARVILGDAGIVTAREDLAIESAYRAQLPANFADRPRKSPITSRNFAGMASFHNYPEGRARGNHWGDALALLKTSSGGPYYYSLHASDPNDPEGGSRRDTGHTFMCGPTGSGKTVLLGFCVAHLTRQMATQVVFDKDHGLELLIGALGGEYRSLANCQDTGINPLHLEPNADNVQFLRSWIEQLVRAPNESLTAQQQAALVRALNGTLALPLQARKLSRLIEFLDPTDPGGLHARLSRWCRSENGNYGWVFDNDEDRVVPLLSASSLIGFDVTDFLRTPEIRGPMAAYLFHIVRALIDGRRLVVWMDEFSTLLDDPSFSNFSKDGLKTWRKLNAVAAFATQSPSDVLRSSIARTLIEQTPTKVFFPNPDADREEHITGLGLSEREYQIIRHQLAPGSRQFLLKQGPASVVCELNLKGMTFELAVISGRAESVRKMHHLKSLFGSKPEFWLPHLMTVGEPLC